MKTKKIEIPKYDPERGIRYKWEDGFKIESSVKNGFIFLRANKEGLISLANHLLNLAQEEIPCGSHLHFDEFNSLEIGSVEFVIEKM